MEMQVNAAYGPVSSSQPPPQGVTQAEDTENPYEPTS